MDVKTKKDLQKTKNHYLFLRSRRKKEGMKKITNIQDFQIKLKVLPHGLSRSHWGEYLYVFLCLE